MNAKDNKETQAKAAEVNPKLSDDLKGEDQQKTNLPEETPVNKAPDSVKSQEDVDSKNTPEEAPVVQEQAVSQETDKTDNVPTTNIYTK